MDAGEARQSLVNLCTRFSRIVEGSRVASRFIRTNQQGPIALTNRIGVPLRLRALRVLLGAASSSDHIMDSSRSSEKEDAYRGTGTK